MTEPRPPLTDEDLSTVLDGDASPAVAERVAGDQAAAGRLADLRAAAALTATPVAPLAPSVVDDLVANALSDVEAGYEGRPAHAPVESPDVARVSSDDAVVAPLRPTGSPRSVPTWLVAAAVAVVVAVGLGLVWSGTRNTSSSTDTAARTPSSAAADQETSKRAATATTAFGAHGGANTTNGLRPEAPATSSESPDGGAGRDGGSAASPNPGDATVPLVGLGTFADADALRAALATQFPSTEATRSDADGATAPTRDAVERCQALVRTTLNGTRKPPPLPLSPDHQGFASIAGSQVLVFEFATTTFEPDRTALVVAVGVDACQPVLTFVR